MVSSLETSRLLHRPMGVGRAVLSRGREPTQATSPAGVFAVERRTVEIAGGPTWRIDVEAAEPHRVIAWETTEGERGVLLASDRLEYWKLHGEKDLPALAKLGLNPRPPRTP